MKKRSTEKRLVFPGNHGPVERRDVPDFNCPIHLVKYEQCRPNFIEDAAKCLPHKLQSEEGDDEMQHL